MRSVLKGLFLTGIGLIAGIVMTGLTVNSSLVHAAAGEKYQVVIVDAHASPADLEIVLNSIASRGCTLVETSGRGVSSGL
jgi:hypothetical protein